MNKNEIKTFIQFTVYFAIRALPFIGFAMFIAAVIYLLIQKAC